MGAWLITKPATIGLTNRTVRRFHLGVMEDAFAENQIAIGCPGKVVQRVMRVFGTEAGHNDPSHVRLAVAIGVLDEGQVRHLRDIDAAIAELERQRYVKVVGKDR